MMKRLLGIGFLCLIFLNACQKDSNTIPDQPIFLDTLKGNISENTVLEEGSNYILEGQVYVTNHATLTIPAGVTVYVKKEEEQNQKGSLIISKGSKLLIKGTAKSPVLFTSDAQHKAPGDWGAIVLLGDAPINTKTLYIHGFQEASETICGGETKEDDSGEIHYLRMEYCGGINEEQEDEWALDKASGLCLAAVGSATKLDHIMISHSRDDAFQFIGGTVNASYLIAYNNGDDAYDFDHGYTGKLQFILSYRTEISDWADRANGIESLNDANASTNQPYTHPFISNATIIGPQGPEGAPSHLNQGIYIRKNTRFSIINSIIAEYPQGGLMVCNRTRPLLLETGTSIFKYNLIHSDQTERAFTWDKNGQEVDLTKVIADPELTAFATNSTNQNQILTAISAFKLTAPYIEAQKAPTFVPQEDSPAQKGAVFSEPDFTSDFKEVSFRGAVGPDNWTGEGWVVW